MSCTIVVGGQFGSEGKGKVVALELARRRTPWVTRCGGPNSGHTVDVDGQSLILRQIPAGADHPNATLLVSAGCVIDEAVLVAETKQLDLVRDRLIIDPRAVLLAPEDRGAEASIVAEIASTGSGNGAALVRRMSRRPHVRLAGHSDCLREVSRLESVAPLLHKHLDAGGDLVVEGTQGFGLSLLHGPFYPHVTSRDTTASGAAAEVGLSPRDVSDVILVIRTFPIRVGGPSGPLPDEISWELVRELSGAPETIPEYTSVTKRLRRVARFDADLVAQAVRYNRPTSLAVMGLDRLDHSNYQVAQLEDLNDRGKHFIAELEASMSTRTCWLGTGFATSEVCHSARTGTSHGGRGRAYSGSS